MVTESSYGATGGAVVKLVALQQVERTSKFALSDLAYRSALELEKARIGESFDRGPISKLARTLSNTSNPNTEGASFKFVEPGYYEPYERLYRIRNHVDPTSVEQIQEFFRAEISKLEEVVDGSLTSADAEELVSFCISLHAELVNALTAETIGAGGQWRATEAGPSPSLSDEARPRFFTPA